MLPERRIRQLFWTGDLAIAVDAGFTGEHALGLISSPFSFNKILPHCLSQSHATFPTLVRLYFGDCGVDLGVSEVRSVGFPLSSSFFFFNKFSSLNRFKAVVLQILLACESLCWPSCSLALWLGRFGSGPSHGCTLFFGLWIYFVLVMCCLFYYCTGMNSIPGAILHESQSCSASTSILEGPFVVTGQDKGKWMMASLLWLLRGALCLLKRLFGGCRRMWIPNILGAGVLHPPGSLLSHAEAVGLEDAASRWWRPVSVLHRRQRRRSKSWSAVAASSRRVYIHVVYKRHASYFSMECETRVSMGRVVASLYICALFLCEMYYHVTGAMLPFVM